MCPEREHKVIKRKKEKKDSCVKLGSGMDDERDGRKGLIVTRSGLALINARCSGLVYCKWSGPHATPTPLLHGEDGGAGVREGNGRCH